MKRGTKAAVQPTVHVVMESEVARQVRQHARGSMKVEVCGVLIGREEGSTTIIEACIAGANATQGGAHVTFTQDTWEHIYQVKDKEYADARIVGWYHSHPGFGVFLSDHDLFIQQNFFSSPQQIAWVYDPHTDEEGCFIWRDGKIDKTDDVAFRFGQPCGETVGKQTEEDELIKIGRPIKNDEVEWIPLLKTAAMCLLFFVVGAAAAFYYITSKALLFPKGGSALVIIEGDRIGVVPQDLAVQMLNIMQHQLDANIQFQKQAAGAANTGAGASSTPQGEQDGRKK